MVTKGNLLQRAKEMFGPLFQSLSLAKQQDIIVFSHIRWSLVFQRPQHVVTRLAKKRTILFVEKPILFHPSDRGSAGFFYPQKNITVLQPKIAPEHIKQDLPLLIAKQIRGLKMHDPILWFYSPAFSEIAPFINHSLVVYDCMNELSFDKDTSSQRSTQEKYLLSLADIIFANGKSLYEEKKKQTNSLYCFPSSVDQKHFAKSDHSETIIPNEIEKFSHPIVGFYGSIDERLDKKLLGQVASNMPDVTFLMIGPINKTATESLPELPNIHYLGPKPYNLLPAYVKAIDVMMLPLVVNETTKFITSAKILELMAASKPIVSTPIPDVVSDYKDVIRIAHDPYTFVKRIRYYLNESSLLREKRHQSYKTILAQNSWDALVSQMQDIIHESLQTKMQKNKNALPSYYPLVPQLTSRG